MRKPIAKSISFNASLFSAALLYGSAFFSSAAAQDTPQIETPEVEISQIEISEIEDWQLEAPQIETGQIEKSLEVGASFIDSVTLTDKASTLVLDNVKTLNLGLRAERELAGRDNISLSGALSAQASFGQGNTSELSPNLESITQTDDAEFRRLGAYADVIARLEGDKDTDWTPFVSAGLGVAQDRVTLDNQVFEDLSPVGRYRAGVEKKVSNNVTFGVSAGQSFKLN